MIFDWCSSCFGWNKLEEEIEELDRPEVKLDSLNMGLGMWLKNFFDFFLKFFENAKSGSNGHQENAPHFSLKSLELKWVAYSHFRRLYTASSGIWTK